MTPSEELSWTGSKVFGIFIDEFINQISTVRIIGIFHIRHAPNKELNNNIREGIRSKIYLNLATKLSDGGLQVLKDEMKHPFALRPTKAKIGRELSS